MTTRLRSVVISLLIVLALAVGASGCIPPFLPSRSTPPPVVSPGATASPTPRQFSRSDIQIIEEAWAEILDNYVDQSQIDTNVLKQAAIEAMVEALKDPYSAYMTPHIFQESIANFQGNLEGIGAQVAIKDDFPVVTPFPDTPASRAGLRAGDQIIEIDGVSAKGMAVQETVRRIRGPAGTQVRLKVQHQGETQPFDVTITRAKINVPSVTFEMRGSIANVRLLQFTEQTDTELTEFLQSMPPSTTGIILDQRSNPGGIVDTVVAVASHFIKEGTVVDLVDNKGRHNTLSVKPTAFFTNLPIVVLVDEFSASGAELLSGALQDYGRAVVAGNQTFGKGSYDNLFQLRDGSGIYLTTGRWLTPNGRAIEGKGIEPDIELDFTQVDGLEWAIDYLKSGKARPATE